MAYHELVNLVREVNAKNRAIAISEAQSEKTGTFGSISKTGDRVDRTEDGKAKKSKKEVDTKDFSTTSDDDFAPLARDTEIYTGKGDDIERPNDKDIADSRILDGLNGDRIVKDDMSNPEDRYENMKAGSSLCKQIPPKDIKKK